MNWADYLIVFFSLLLIIVVMLQQSKDDAREAFSGGNTEQKGKSLAGFDRFLTITGGVLIVLLIAFIVISRLIHIQG